MRFAAITVTCFISFPLLAAEVRVHPGQKGIYVYEVDARRGISNAIIQNLAVVQPAGDPVQLEDLTIELRAGDRVRQTVRFDADDLAKAGARMGALEKAGLLDLYDFAFQRKRYLPEGTRVATSATIAPGSALILTSIPLLVSRGVDSARIVAKGEGGVSASLDVPLIAYKQANEYSFPIAGASIAAVGPGLSEPHRWAMNEEFALDIVRTGASGKTCRGECAKLGDYYGWGAGVRAVADGVVVRTVADAKESSSRLRQPGESADAFMQRTKEAQDAMMSSSAAALAGNLIVIQHAGGEYSHYAHLAQGSVVVKRGDRVKRGQNIAKLGHTGNSTEPHLHFGIADGPDPLFSRSLPVRFTGLTNMDGPLPPAYVQSGWVVDAK